MTEDFPVTIVSDKHDTRYELDATPVKVRIVRFYLGRRGPYTETFDADTYTVETFRARADALRRTLVDMAR